LVLYKLARGEARKIFKELASSCNAILLRLLAPLKAGLGFCRVVEFFDRREATKQE